MASLKDIRKRISSVKSTQKITRAMKMVAGARLNRAQTRITELRPYAVTTQSVLSEITHVGAETEAGGADKPDHPLLAKREERRVLLVVLTSDRGLCGGFNTNINKRAEQEWKRRTEEGQDVQMILLGRKGRDYFTRRNAPIREYIPGVWDKLEMETAKKVGLRVLAPFLKAESDVDAIYLVYNEFKSAMTQKVVVERLLPVAELSEEDDKGSDTPTEFLFEPDKTSLLQLLVPMYVDISILRALYESMASELGARMTAMDSATKNATEMIDSLTLQYNKARQAGITKELMEIVGGSEALKD